MRRTLSLTVVSLSAALLAAAACAQDTPPAPGKDEAPPAPAPKDEPKKEAPVETWEKTASGLEYQVLVPGKDGPKPKDGDSVKVSYKGWLENGHVFDASERHGGPATFQVGGLIAGWNEALTMMNVGAKWKLRIQPSLGYGAQAMGDIPANSVLQFELELHDLVALPPLPVFVKPNPDAQKTTPSGLRYEVLKEGSGTPPTADEAMELRYAFFAPNGKLLDCSERRRPIKARPKDMNLAFLKEAPLLLKPGARYRFEVPPALMFGDKENGPDLPPNSTTYWELEMVQVLRPMPLPKFEIADESKFTKRESGLLVQIVKEGSGSAPKMGQTVRVHYAGWLTDGTVFDSSYERGDPAEFQLGGVIQGWNEGLQLLKPGGVCRLVIPAKLAYGDSPPRGSKITAGATLVFHVELLEVK